MRAHLVGAAVLGTLALSVGLLSPATAATRVDGAQFDRAGMQVVSQGCNDPALVPSSEPNVIVTRDPDAPLGRGVLGWRAQQPGYVTAPMVHVDSPATLQEIAVSVRRRESSLFGLVLARYTPPGDSGEWRGFGSLGASNVDGWRAADGTESGLRWRHYDAAGMLDQVVPETTIPAFVATHGGDGDGAWIGIGFGCNGESFDLDGLTVETATERKVINFEPHKSKASLERAGKGAARKATMIAGGNIRLKAVLRNLDGKRISGQARLLRADKGSKKFKPVGKVRLRKSKATVLKLAPRYNSVYKLRYPGTSSRLPSTSKTVTVKVRANARAHLSTGTVIAGNAVTVKGRFGPARKAKLALQKYVGGEWTNIKRFRSAKDGTFQTTLVNRRVGKSYWRVWVPRGGGNLPGHSSTMKLVTKPKPKPKPDRPNPPTQPPSNPTPPPDNDPQPPLPPTGPQ